MPSFLRGPFGEPPSNIKSPNPTPNPFLWQSIIYIMRYLHCSCYLHFPYRLHLSSSSSPLPIRPLAVSRQSHRFQQSPPSVAFNFHQGAFVVSHLLIPNHTLSTFNFHRGALVLSHLLIPNHALSLAINLSWWHAFSCFISSPLHFFITACCGEPSKIMHFHLQLLSSILSQLLPSPSWSLVSTCSNSHHSRT